MVPRPRPKLAKREGGSVLPKEAQRLAEQPWGVVVVQGGGESLLGEFFAVFPQGYGDVQITQRAVAEAALEVDLAGSGIEEIRAADDMGDALGFVIDDNGELVGRKTIGAQ